MVKVRAPATCARMTSLPVRLTCSATTAWSPTKETAATNGSHVQHQVTNAAGASAESYRPGHDNPAWFLSV